MGSLPKDFLWGGATAANQCEGGYLEGRYSPYGRDGVSMLPLFVLLVQNFPHRGGGTQ